MQAAQLAGSCSPVMCAQRSTAMRSQQRRNQHRAPTCFARPRKQPQPSRRTPQRSPIKGATKAPTRTKPQLPWRLKPKKPTSKQVDSEPRWQFLNLKAYSQAEGWQVPWGWPTIVIGTGLWAVSFVVTGILAIPIAVYGFGVTDLSSITPLQQSQIQLLDQVLSTVAAVSLVRYIAQRQAEDVPDDFLTISLRKPFQKPYGWAAWSLLGLASAPLAIFATSLVSSILPVDLDPGSGTVGAVSGMIGSAENQVFINLLLVTGVLAPVLEETVFRGFLLTSLTKQMSAPAAVALSSLLFAACHFSVRDFPQLFALGVVMGFAYLRSRNLMTSIAIHGLWNSSVILILFVLVSNGVTIEQILEQK